MARLPRLPPIHALVAFESAARLGGFAPAAVELCITPSAVSHRVRLLEEFWGVQLFERSPSGVRLSSAGLSYLKGVREAFERLAPLGIAEPDAQVRVRVSAPPTFARNLLIPRLGEFHGLYPDIGVDVFVVVPLQDKPERHDVDIRFGAPPFDDRPAARLFDDELVALAAPAFLARQPLPRAQDLTEAMLLRSPLLPWKPWFAAVGLERAEPERGAAFADLGLLLEAAASGLGVALCTRRVARQWLESGQLEAILGPPIPSEQTYWLLMRADAPAGVLAFSEWLREAVA